MGLEPTEVGGFISEQVLVIHPAYEIMFEGFHPEGLKGNERTEWAVGELKKCVDASVNLGTDVIPRFPVGSPGTWFIPCRSAQRALSMRPSKN